MQWLLPLLAALGCAAPRVEPGHTGERAPDLQWAESLAQLKHPAQRVQACARKLGVDVSDWTECRAAACGDGAAVIVTGIAECGADSCDGQQYVLTARGTRELPFGGHKVCSRDGAFVISDVQLTPSTEEAFHDPRQWNVVLQRIPTGTGPATELANCMSPALAPDGRRIACRDRSGAVLVVPLHGGTPAPVASSGVPEDDVAYNPLSEIYPAPPRFEGGRLHYTVETHEGVVERSIAWP